MSTGMSSAPSIAREREDFRTSVFSILPGEKFQTIPGRARTFSYCGLQVQPGLFLIAGSKYSPDFFLLRAPSTARTFSYCGLQVQPGLFLIAGSKYSPHPVSMWLEGLTGLKQGLQAGKNTWPSIGAGSISGVILGPLVMRHCYFGGFGLGQQFDRCA